MNSAVVKGAKKLERDFYRSDFTALTRRGLRDGKGFKPGVMQGAGRGEIEMSRIRSEGINVRGNFVADSLKVCGIPIKVDYSGLRIADIFHLIGRLGDYRTASHVITISGEKEGQIGQRILRRVVCVHSRTTRDWWRARLVRLKRK